MRGFFTKRITLKPLSFDTLLLFYLIRQQIVILRLLSAQNIDINIFYSCLILHCAINLTLVTTNSGKRYIVKVLKLTVVFPNIVLFIFEIKLEKKEKVYIQLIH